MRSKRSAFTLIELLVVIAIIALLISVLLPALKGARLQAMKIRSLANIQQTGLGGRMYGDDNRGYMPIILSYQRGVADVPNYFAWCTWSFGGKNCDPFWYNYQSGVFDVEAADRPLNPYLMPNQEWYAPPIPTRLAANDPSRKVEAMPFRDPSDKFTRQRNWPNEGTISSYDDVGTSYHWSYRWFYGPFPPGSTLNPNGSNAQRRAVFEWGTRQMRIADGFQSSRFVWVYDQTADVVVNNNQNFVNGYGDVNKSVSGFLDGHGAYIKYEKGVPRGADYTLIFSFQRN